MSEHLPSQTFDRQVLRTRLARALAEPDYPDFLHQHAARDIASRLELILRDFETALILADKPDDLTERMRSTGRFGQIMSARTIAKPAVETAPQIVCNEEFLPIAEQSLDCVISVLNLQLINDLPGALVQMFRALRPDGLFLAALL
ncbi:MAG: class I SAM-dependent methyltransferase, partial [Aestuariivirgaceae bacterium]